MPIPALPTSDGGPCSWVIDTGCCPTWSEYSVELQASATRFATLVLWASTGRRFGACELTVRPCGRHWSNTDTGLWTLDPQDGHWTPYIMDGQWNNCLCGTSPCCCEPSCQVRLPGPVLEVTEVLVDGVAVADSAWRVDNRQWLVRTDGDCWPDCSDMDVDSGTGLFQVTYLRGKAVPPPLAVAAGTLACEFAKACLGSACRLPQRVTTIARQGVTVQLVDVDRLLDRGLTGITEVDQVITALNPNGLKGRPRLYSPDIDSVRQVTQA